MREVERIVRSAGSIARELSGPGATSPVVRRWLRAAVTQLERHAAEVADAIPPEAEAERHLAAIGHHLVARLVDDAFVPEAAGARAADLDQVALLLAALGPAH